MQSSDLFKLNTTLLNAFRANDHARFMNIDFMNIDKELENAMGSKERAIERCDSTKENMQNRHSR
jgi:hypothetical protein